MQVNTPVPTVVLFCLKSLCFSLFCSSNEFCRFFRVAAKSETESIKAKLQQQTEEQANLASQLKTAQSQGSQSEKSLANYQQQMKQLQNSLDSSVEEKERLQTQGMGYFGWLYI